ncbi:ribosome silencing factor [Marinospirillum insulare]|uniref:Ribosomal silencing factor RsfS n=1 Tax=Marinospirillum insulare TaxID=217169 RepID=A0ABQ5ZWB5_9GAMM|nr:ribosome silencing factor [Marinospirillum insulare]GLR62662.1 ribosomal silencing factor RsfS [Marinospirillum insulare]
MQTEQLKQTIVAALEDLKAQDLIVLDVKAATSVTDYMIIASGTSSRQVIALARNVQSAVRELNVEPLGVEGLDAGEWVLVDLGDIIVHLMQPQVRELYDLEKLWGEFASPINHQA